MLKAEIEETKKGRWMKKAASAFCFFPLKMLETSPQMAGMLAPLDAQTCSPHTPGEGGVETCAEGAVRWD